MASKNHHFIPRMHLARFCRKGTMYVYDKRWGVLHIPKTPKGQAYEEFLYSFTQEGGHQTSVIEDKFLSNIDSMAAVELTALHQMAAPKSLSVLSNYIASLVVRNPKAIERNRLHGSAMLKEIFPRMLKDLKIQESIRETSKDEEDFKELMSAASHAQVSMARDFAMTTQISLLPSVSLSLLNANWQILIAQGCEQFVLADTPAFTCDPNSSHRSVAALSRHGNETTIPISPQICILVGGIRGSGFCRRFVSDEVVREVNRRSAYSAHRRFFAASFRTCWQELIREFPAADIEVDIVKTKNKLNFLQIVDNQHFHPIA